MPDPRARLRLQDILDEIEGIRSITTGRSFAEFDEDWAMLRATLGCCAQTMNAIARITFCE